ncbi:MAG: hypothetical protein FJ100_05945 [Deltaproteobacteria bacterium]|nr:hypothetical protein [Deltaproteobacteria bacterium]
MKVALAWPRLVAGVVVPGLGLALRRQWIASLWALFAVAHLVALAWADATALVQRFEGSAPGAGAPVAWAPARLGPQAAWALALAIAVHALAAWAGGRVAENRQGQPSPNATPPAAGRRDLAL